MGSHPPKTKGKYPIDGPLSNIVIGCIDELLIIDHDLPVFKAHIFCFMVHTPDVSRLQTMEDPSEDPPLLIGPMVPVHQRVY